MNKYICTILLTTFFIGSCAPAIASPTELPAATPTQTITPSQTLPPALISIPIATPYPPLQTEGPYLLYSTDWSDLTILDADGKGRKQFQLPNEGFVRDLKKAVSPDGKWLAYFTGSSHKEPYNLALHLLSLEDQTTIHIANLIAPGFPDNLESVKTSDPVELESCNSGPCRISVIELAFNEGIESMDWSPDSRSLAFAAQIDGPSSDVYIFSIEGKSIRRLVGDLENVWRIDWSPNGNRILYQNSTAGVTYTSKYLYIADPNINKIQSPEVIYSGKFWYIYGWINEKSCLISSGGEGASAQHFRYIDVETQQTKEVWPYTAEYIVIDSMSEKIVLTTIPGGYLDNEPEEGTYILSVDGNYSKITNDLFVLYEGFRESQVLGWRNDQIYDISLDGTTTLIGPSKWDQHQKPLASPDQKWIFLLENQSKITLYSVDTYEQIKAWNIDEYVYGISWRPDSLGIFLSTETHIYYLPIPNGEPVPLDDCPPNNFCGYKDFVWLP